MGQYAKIVLAHGEQLHSPHNAENDLPSKDGMDVPGGCLLGDIPVVIDNRPLRNRTVGGVEGAEGLSSHPYPIDRGGPRL